jgi:hypothetical protein
MGLIRLRAELADEDISIKMNEATMKQPAEGLEKVFVGRNGMEAHFVRGLLDAEGIRAEVLGEMLDAARGDIPFTSDSMPGVWVRGGEAARAREVIAEYERRKRPGAGPGLAGSEWICPGCGEKIEEQFDQCWNCQAMREGH